MPSLEPSRIQPKRNGSALSSERIFNSSSPIVNRDIQAFLSICILNWTNYSESEKRSIISSLPPAYRHFNTDQDGCLLCPISAEFVAEDRVLKDNIARFQRDVSEGYHTKTWQERARKANEERTEGKFDQYLKDHVEEMFGDAKEEEDESGRSSDGEFRSGKATKKGKSKGERKGRDVANRARKGRMAEEMGFDENAGD